MLSNLSIIQHGIKKITQILKDLEDQFIFCMFSSLIKDCTIPIKIISLMKLLLLQVLLILPTGADELD